MRATQEYEKEVARKVISESFKYWREAGFTIDNAIRLAGYEARAISLMGIVDVLEDIKSATSPSGYYP